MNIDKNTIIGFVLMGAVLFGFLFYNNSKAKENAEKQQEALELQEVRMKEEKENQALRARQDSIRQAEVTAMKADSSYILRTASIPSDDHVEIANDLLRLTISSRGGQISRAELLDPAYKAQDKMSQVVLFDNDDSELSFRLNLQNADKSLVPLDTKDTYFQTSEKTGNSVVMRLPVDNGANGEFAISYELVPNSYIVKVNVLTRNLYNNLPDGVKTIEMEWNEHVKQQEKGYTFENRYSTITYRDTDGDTEELSNAGMPKYQDEFDYNAVWIAFKTQFFSQVLISEKPMNLSSLESYTVVDTLNYPKTDWDVDGSGYLKHYSAKWTVPFDATGKSPIVLHYYLGPNKFSTLSDNESLIKTSNDLDLQSLVYLGWPVIRWINKYFMVYLFGWMTSWGINMGIVLLLLTLLIKFLVYPLMKKSYISSAYMRVLRPKVDEISKKYPNKEDAMKKQQETMQLYSQYGVSPMGGCLPMLIQMPIWIALFNFIPNAIELRGESFLWADDLSTYDDVLKWNGNIWGVGNHLSIFCVLWCVSTIANTWISMRQQKYSMSEEQQKQMGCMRWFSYLMPLIFFFTFNSYSSGLTYYYFVSGLITILMMWWLRKHTDDAQLLKTLEERFEKRKSDPQKKGGLMSRYEKMLEMQRQMEEKKRKQQK